MALLDNIPGWKVFSTGIGIAALIVVAWFVYAWFFAAPSDLKPLERQALDDALAKLGKLYAGEMHSLGERRVVLMPIQPRDTSNGEIRDRAFRALNGVQGVKAIKPPSADLEERAVAAFKGILGRSDEKPDPAAVLDKAAEADEVVTLDVRIKSGVDAGQCDIVAWRILRDAADEPPRLGEPLKVRGLSGSAAEGQEVVENGPGLWDTAWAFIWRGLIVLAAGAIIPWLSAPIATRVFERDSNAANATLLLVLTSLTVLVLFATVAFSINAGVIVAAIVLFILAGLYNLAVLNRIEERA